MFATRTASWSCLPVEMKLSIVDQLDLDDVRTFAKVDREAYNLSIPALFRVRLPTHVRYMRVCLTAYPEREPLERRGAATICCLRAKAVQSAYTPTHHLHQACSAARPRIRGPPRYRRPRRPPPALHASGAVDAQSGSLFGKGGDSMLRAPALPRVAVHRSLRR